jgi:hypothetical protein
MKELIKNRLACALLALLAAVYLAFLSIDLFVPSLAPWSSYLKYLGILLCLATAASLHRQAWSREDSRLLLAALALTCGADLFLLLWNRPVPGLLVFFLVHLVYIRRYQAAIFLPAAIATLTVVAGIMATGLLIPGFPLPQALAAVYGALILTVTVCGIRCALPLPNRRLVVAGMALFLLCDIHVALFNALPQGNPYFPAAAVLMWFFYLPAQALLALSGFNFKVPCNSPPQSATYPRNR